MSTSPSSERTNEDPTGAGSIAAQAILTLTPSNAAAKRAFSDVVGWTLQRSQEDTKGETQANSGSRLPDSREHAKKLMWISSEQTADPDVSRFVRQNRLGQLSPSPSSSFDATAAQKIEPQPAIDIWTGCYFLDLDHRPIRPGGGWRAGRLNEQTLNDLVLSVDHSSAIGVRVRHIILQVHDESGRMYVRSVTDKAEVEVDGVSLSRGQIHVMNNRSTSLRIGQLAYAVEYGHFACSEGYCDEYNSKLKIYIQNVLGKAPTKTFALTPTPSWSTRLTVGQWTISSAGTIGSGGGGRVSAAMNSSGDIVALKRMTATKGSKTLRRRINTLQLLTKLADDAREDRILRLREVITDDPTGSNASFDVWLALVPALPETLYDYRDMSLVSTPQGIAKTTSIIKSILEALVFLHSHQWIHGDIKLPNIGIQEWNETSASVVLVDLDDATYAPTGHVSPAAGTTGTVGWLSPERELTGLTATADVWGVGVAAIWLLFGRQPWPCLAKSTYPVNPWRPGPEYEKQRPQFHKSFGKAIADIHRYNLGGEAILCMIRHPYALDERYKKPRPTSQEVLDILNGDKPAVREGQEPPSKRLR